MGVAADTSDAGIACRQIGPIAFLGEKKGGERVFDERRSDCRVCGCRDGLLRERRSEEILDVLKESDQIRRSLLETNSGDAVKTMILMTAGSSRNG